MVASALGAVAVIALVLLAVGVANPLIPLIIFALAGIPLGLMMGGRLFRHAPGASGATSSGATTPSTREASYDPVSDPSDRA